jgi:hypothetical protein
VLRRLSPLSQKELLATRDAWARIEPLEERSRWLVLRVLCDKFELPNRKDWEW